MLWSKLYVLPRSNEAADDNVHPNVLPRSTEIAIDNELRMEKIQCPEFTLPALPYAYDALEPTIDTET